MPRPTDEDNKNWGGKRAGAGRKPQGVEKVTISVSVSKRVVDFAKLAAKAKKVTLSAYVERALEELFSRELLPK